MSQKSISSLSTKRIVISLLLFLAIPVCAHISNIFAQQSDICFSTFLNLFAFLLLFYDWNLFTIHYNRSKYNLSTTGMYFVIGLILLTLLSLLNRIFINGTFVLPLQSSLIRYGYARPSMYVAFSFSQALVLTIIYKCLTDRFEIQGKELQVLLLSSFLLAFVYLICFIPFSFEIWIRTLLYNILLFLILGYLYNQSHSMMPGLLSMTLVYLLLMLL